MSRTGRAGGTLAAIVIATLLAGAGVAPMARAQTTPDRSEVVLVFDFSASILQDATNRKLFAVALEGIAARVDETQVTSDLVAGDATVSIVQFAAKAVDYPGCADLKLLGSAPTVAHFADCLRLLAGAYRKGLDPALTRSIGIDTNYVAAMQRAASHLPRDGVRQTMILFTDGKHDVKGVPLSQVQLTRDQLFGSRSPFALLPVGMGLDPKERDALEAGLVRLQIVNMPTCTGGTSLTWPKVVFESPVLAGNAVGDALHNATCTFTVAPVATPSPTPAAAPAAVHGITLTARDGAIDVTWAAPASTPVPIVDYRVRCQAGDGNWIESSEGVSLATTATIGGLTNGTAYQCQVATVGASSVGAWTAAPATATPLGRPGAPGKPSVEPLDSALKISVPPNQAAGVSGYHYECSGDNGATWPATADQASANNTTALIEPLTNGVGYVCRAFAENATGLSDASPISDAVRPCGSVLDCNTVLRPVLALVVLLLAAGILVVLVLLWRERNRGYVVAVVDVIHTANLGHGSRLGISFVRSPGSRRVTGIVADRGPNAEIRIRLRRGGRFEVTDRVGRHVTSSGEPIVAADSVGVRHELVLRAFATNAASTVSSRG
jgi:hypothetical protein